MRSLRPPAKLTTLDTFAPERERLREQSLRLVLTNGCFDLLHPGHVSFLQQARALGDRLVVALNSDSSVRALKGPSRPIYNETERAFALAALSCVDHLVLFSTPHLVAEIRMLGPEVYTKAGDYTLDTLHAREREALQEIGARIVFLPFLAGYSTSNLLRRIQNAKSS